MNIITKLNIRQKVMLILTILAAVFLTWQIYHFVQNNSSTAAPTAGAPVAAAAPVTLPPPIPMPVSQLPVTNPVLTVRQREYLNLVREYQITKMERQILEEKAGLANAQKRIDDTGRSTSFTGVSGVGSSDFVNDNNEYQLAYIDRQAGRWSATLSQGDAYKEVHVGSRLGNGAKVLSINGTNVVLQQVKGKKLVLSFQGSVNVDNNESAYTIKSKHLEVTAVKPQAQVQPVAQVPVINDAVNPSKAKIAKILGITTKPEAPKAPAVVTVPVAPVAAPAAPVAAPQQSQAQSSTDIPAAPLTVTPAAQPPAKPVSVKELRESQKLSTVS